MARAARHANRVAGGRAAAERKLPRTAEVAAQALGIIAWSACLQDEPANRACGARSTEPAGVDTVRLDTTREQLLEGR